MGYTGKGGGGLDRVGLQQVYLVMSVAVVFLSFTLVSEHSQVLPRQIWAETVHIRANIDHLTLENFHFGKD